MLEDLWTGILDLTAQFVIPDWGALIALLPDPHPRPRRRHPHLDLPSPAPGAGRPRRGKQRIDPRTPAGIHMPGPSMSPVFAAIGAFLLFLGLVFGGPILILGVDRPGPDPAVLAGRGAADLRPRHRRHRAGPAGRDPRRPAARRPHAGPSFRPFLGAVGTAMLMLGLVFGGWLLAAGVIALILTLVGWLVDAVKEYRKTVEADTTGHLENIPAPRTPSLLLWVLARPAHRRRRCCRPAGCRRATPAAPARPRRAPPGSRPGAR